MIGNVNKNLKQSINKIPIHDANDFEMMRKAGNLAADVLDYITDFVDLGVTTGKLNDLCHEYILAHGAIPAPLNYRGFPKSICTSINHVICHGIPDDSKKLQNGDVLNIDVTVILNGYYGDTSRMYFVGKNINPKAKRLTQVTYDCMMKGIEIIKPGVNLNEIGRVIQELAHKAGYSVVRDFCGHGIGKEFHTEPSVLHFYEAAETRILEEGMFFTVEPMINAGHYESRTLIDGWTAVTRDKSLSAQFEHTVAVTSTGYEIFTLSNKGYTLPPYK
jgi:methionyl aminopeptidase